MQAIRWSEQARVAMQKPAAARGNRQPDKCRQKCAQRRCAGNPSGQRWLVQGTFVEILMVGLVVAALLFAAQHIAFPDYVVGRTNLQSTYTHGEHQQCYNDPLSVAPPFLKDSLAAYPKIFTVAGMQTPVTAATAARQIGYARGCGNLPVEIVVVKFDSTTVKVLAIITPFQASSERYFSEQDELNILSLALERCAKMGPVVRFAVSFRPKGSQVVDTSLLENPISFDGVAVMRACAKAQSSPPSW